MKMRLTLFFLILFLSIHVSAQDLRYIPDVNLRKALTEQGFTTNDSLDLNKIEGRLILKLGKKGIVNIDGLQYFKRVWLLDISHNKIENLDYLPPNLKSLDCLTNKIKEIKNLPPKLERLDIMNNEISLIENLPASLKHLDFRINKMTYLPELPANIEFVNYAANPIPFDSLPPEYQDFACDEKDTGDNCLPYKFVKWNILNSDMTKLPQNITRMTVEVNSGHSTIETFDFEVQGSDFIANRVKVAKRYRDSTDVVYIHNKYTVEVGKVQDILNDIYAGGMSLAIPRQDDTIRVDMSKKKVFCPGCYCGYSSHDAGYAFTYILHTETGTFKLKHSFIASRARNGLAPCEYTTHGNIKRALNWFYSYKLTNLILKDHKITKRYFTNKHLENSVKIVEKEY